MRKTRKTLLLLVLMAVVTAGVLSLLPDRPPAAETSAESTTKEGSKSPGRDAPPDRSGPDRPASGDRGEAREPRPPGSLPGDLGLVLGDDPKTGSRARIQILRDREASFNGAEIEGILTYLQSGIIPEGIRTEEWHWIVDELFTRLRTESGDPKDLTRKLADLFANVALDPVVRDYALQHVGHLGREGGDAAVAHASALRGLEETGSPLAGTALLVLHNEPGSGGGKDPLAGARAVELFRNENAAVPARVTALQVAARHGAEGTLGAASELLVGEASAFLKVAAIAAIGEVGSESDLPLLQSLPADNPILQRAVRAAIQKLTRDPE